MGVNRVCVVLLLLLGTAGSALAENLRFIDAHGPVPASVSMDTVLSIMDRAGVSRGFLASFNDPQYPLGREHTQKHQADLIAFAASHPERVTLAIGLKRASNRAGDSATLERIRREAASPRYGALAEVIVVHAAKGRTLPEMIVGLDHRSVQEARTIALKRGWPLILHIEFGHTRLIGEYERYMRDLERLLVENPGLPVVLIHMGQLEPKEASRLVAAHGNLYFLTSNANPIVIAAKGGNHPWTDLFSGDAIAPAWREVMVAHPDRFVFGVDAAINADWSNRYVDQVGLWRTALNKLPEPVARAIAHGNAERLWKLGSKPAEAAARVSPPQAQGAGRPATATQTPGADDDVVGPRGLTVRELLRNADADGDGRLSRNEFRGPPQAFDLMDADRDGALAAPEIAAHWRRLAGRAGTGGGGRPATAPTAAAPAAAAASASGDATIDPGSLPEDAKALLRRVVGSGWGATTNIEGRARPERHNAVDIRGRSGDDVLAAADGRVGFVGDTPRGLAVVVAHGQNADGFWYFTTYMHNSENLVKRGDTVKRGQVIARLGSTGTAGGAGTDSPHVHFQLDRSPEPQRSKDRRDVGLDPNRYWNAERICFEPDRSYPDRPLRLTLPIRCLLE